MRDEDEERERHRRVAERVHYERLLRGPDGARPFVPEADQAVRREADQSPADEEHEQVPALDEHEHREDEERDVREVAPLLRVAVHVTDRVEDDQPADAADDQHHHGAERVDQQLEVDTEIAAREPGPGARVLAVMAALGVQVEESPDGAAEGDEDTGGRKPGGSAACELRPAKEDENRRHERREETDPPPVGHPRNSESRSTSSGSFLRLIATTRPRPTQTSDAATAITARPKICPSPFAKWRENAMSARLPPLSISSRERRTMSGFRRMRTPSAPIPNRKAAS